MAGMTASTQPHLDTVRAMLVDHLGDRLAPGVIDYADVFADDGVLELPFGKALRLEGKAAIRTYTDALLGTITLGPRVVTAVHDAGEVVVMEYRGSVENTEHRRTFEQSYIAVFHIRDGRIALFREYLDATRLPQSASDQ